MRSITNLDNGPCRLCAKICINNSALIFIIHESESERRAELQSAEAEVRRSRCCCKGAGRGFLHLNRWEGSDAEKLSTANNDGFREHSAWKSAALVPEMCSELAEEDVCAKPNSLDSESNTGGTKTSKSNKMKIQNHFQPTKKPFFKHFRKAKPKIQEIEFFFLQKIVKLVKIPVAHRD